MKPLPLAPLPAEEIAANVWWLRKRHWKWANALAVVSISQNARDTDLMLQAQRHKLVAALQRTDDGSRIDLRLGAGIHVAHLGLTLPAR
jgi:hypothetical protein